MLYEWSVILGTGCFDGGITCFSPITLYSPEVFKTLDGRFDRSVITVGVMYRVL